MTLIDIESQVYSAVSAAIKADFLSAYTAGEYVDAPTRFPAMMIFQADSSIYQRARTVNIENANNVTFTAYVFSNKVSTPTGGKKQEANEIMNIVDDKMAELGFTRTSRIPVPNFADNTIYQIVSRYSAVVDKDNWIYQS